MEVTAVLLLDCENPPLALLGEPVPDEPVPIGGDAVIGEFGFVPVGMGLEDPEGPG